ncbi:MAG: hypothetical protein ACK2UC_09860 [Anaerolineae bacterium]
MRDSILHRLASIAMLAAALTFVVASPTAAGPSAGQLQEIRSETDGLPGIRYLHVSTPDNVSGNSTYLDHPLLNDNPNAVLFVTQNINAGGGFSGTLNEHELGVWYDAFEGKWAIFNQDGAAMPVGSDYNVLIPDPASAVFVHTATAGNTNSHWTYLDHPQVNNHPDALLFVTQNWNPGGVGGTYNDHPVGVWYDDTEGKWAVFNQDLIDMPEGAAFNVLVAGAEAEAFVHDATAGNIISGSTLVDYGPTNGDTHALLFVTQNWNPGGGGGVYNAHSVATSYNPLYDQWSMGNLEPGMTVPMTEGAAFNVLVVHTQEPFFTHVATAGNSSGNSTYVDQPYLNGEPNAVALVTQNWNPGGQGGTYNDRPVGVWYDGLAEAWAVFNQDAGNMPDGAAFNLLVPNMDAGVLVHQATATNITNNSSFMDHPLLDNEPEAIVMVTQNWNPGGEGGTYNSHPVGVWYNDLSGQWAVFNQDEVDMPVGADFNVFVPLPGPNVFVHEATAGNSSGNSTYLDHPLLNNRPSAKVLVTQNWNPGGGLSGVYNPHVVGVWYSGASDQWAIFNQDGATMPDGASFNVVVELPKVYLPLVLRAP